MWGHKVKMTVCGGGGFLLLGLPHIVMGNADLTVGDCNVCRTSN